MLRFAVFCILVNLAAAEGVHWQWRDMICKATGKDGGSRCEILLREEEKDPNPRSVPLDTCFEETVDGKTREYCNLMCPGADTVYRIFVYPKNHKSCFSHYTYRLEKREDQFYMWRSEKCRAADVHFTIRCEFTSARAKFIGDEKLFEETKKVLAKARV